MRAHLLLVSSLAFSLGMLICHETHADVAPDPDSADAHCTLAEQCPGGTFCSYENNADDPAVKEQTDACIAEAKAKGLAYRCTDGGGTVGEKLYCPQGETGSWNPGGCSRCSVVTPASSSGDAWPWLAAAVGLSIARRRSRSGAEPRAHTRR